MGKTGAFVFVVCGLVGALAVTVWTAEKPSDAYVKAMKDVGAAVQGANTAMKAEDYAAVGKSAASIIETMPVVEKYWTGKAEDASKMVQTAIKAAQDLRVAAGLSSGEGVAYSFKELTDTCGACHAAHREKLADGSFQIK